MRLDKSNPVYQGIRRLERRLRNAFVIPVKAIFFKRKLRRAMPVFLYQMGKVASTSVYYSILNRYPGVLVHAHGLEIADWKSRIVYEWYRKGNPIKLISLTREPISRNISSFFQRFEFYTGEPFRHSRLSIEELQAVFFEKFNHVWALEWFDQHIKKDFGIDVYAQPFPERGYAEYQGNNVQLLVLKSELDDPTKERVLSDFVGLRGLELPARNLGSRKEYTQCYREFKNTLRLNEKLRRKLVDSKYYQHFYGRHASRKG